MTGGLLRCTPSACFKGEYPCPGKPRCIVCPECGIMYPRCDIVVQYVIVRDGTAKVLERVDILDLCAI